MLQFSKVFSIKLSSRNTNNGAAASFLAAAPYSLSRNPVCTQEQTGSRTYEKPSLIMMLSAKQEASYLLGEDAEERQARQLIMHRNQEQHQNSFSKRKRNDPER